MYVSYSIQKIFPISKVGPTDSRQNLSTYSGKYQHTLKGFQCTEQLNFDKRYNVLAKDFPPSPRSRPQHHLSATHIILSSHPSFDKRDWRPEMHKSAIIHLCLLSDRLCIRCFFQHLLCMAQFSDRQCSSARFIYRRALSTLGKTKRTINIQ